MVEPRKITELDHEWRDVYAAWIRNGKPYQFDRYSELGGAIYHCPDYRTVDRPDFFVHAEAGPTVLDEEHAGGPVTLGWTEKLTRMGFVRFRQTGPRRTRKLKITVVPLPRDRI